MNDNFCLYSEARRDGGPKDTAQFYLDQLLPVARDAVLAEPEGAAQRDAFDTLVCLLGRSPEAVALATAVIRPKRLAVVTTPEIWNGDGVKQALELMLSSADVGAGVSKEVHLCERADVLAVYRVIESELTHAQRDRTAALIAGGTNEMVAALSAGAFAAQIRVLYLEGHGNPPQPESQRLRVVPNPLAILGGLDRAEADAAFRAGRFEEAEAIYRKLAAAQSHYTDSALAVFAKLYAAVQKGDYTMQVAHRDTAEFPEPLRERASTVARALPMLRQRDARNREIWWTASAAWLEATARRQYDAGQYAHAAATAYRALEAIVQVECLIRFAWPERVNLEEVRPDLREAASELQSKELRARTSLRGLLGLLDRWAVLRSDGDPIGKLSDLQAVRDAISVRNDSLLGHGFETPTVAKCQRLLDLVRAAAKALHNAEQFGRYLDDFTFLSPSDIRRTYGPANNVAEGRA